MSRRALGAPGVLSLARPPPSSATCATIFAASRVSRSPFAPGFFDGVEEPDAYELCWRYMGPNRRFCRPAPHYPWGLQTTVNGAPVDGRYVS